MKIAVVGGSGYAGAEVLRLLASVRDAQVVCVTGDSSAGRALGELHPSLSALYGDTTIVPTAAVLDSTADVVFVALPHGESQKWVPQLRTATIIDLGADYRLSVEAYEQWYGHAHRDRLGVADARYGLVERYRDRLRGAQLIAAPGCYPTATSLAVAPFSDAGIITGVVTVNALSGVSGAGRAPSDRYHFPRLAGGAEAYGMTGHRHTPEMEREIGSLVQFTPHLIPISRGMLVTATATLARDMASDEVYEYLLATYQHDPCVIVRRDPPSAKDALGSNAIHVAAVVSRRTNQLVMMSAMDNLGKGAAGQAVQAWNVARGANELTGLSLAGVAP